MGKTAAIDKLDPKTRQKVKKDILSKKKPVRQIAKEISEHIRTSPTAVQEYKDKLKGEIAEKAAKEAQETWQIHQETLVDVQNMARSMNALYYEWLEKVRNGDDEADKRLAQLLAIARELRPMLADLAKMTGDIKEAAEEQSQPTVILAQIQQIFQQYGGDDNAIIKALDGLR